MLYLGDVATGRDNNFNLIRFAAAASVLVSHAWPIALGPGTAEPLQALTGHTLGTLAVYVFFAISGFFISASFAASASAGDFLLARGLRLFPCLAVSLLLVAFAMGPFVTTQPAAGYLQAPETWRFLFHNATLVWPQYRLPGVFETNPYPAVEGSIWTLIHEVLCYALVFLAGLTGLSRRRRAMTAALIGYGLIWALPLLLPFRLPPRVMSLHDLSLPFVFGMAFWLWRDRLPLTLWAVAGLLGAASLARGTSLGTPLLVAFLAYATFWAGFVPKGPIRAWNRLGDYSYGMYVYAFPLQGLAVWLAGPLTPMANVALALPVTLVFAILSWHLVERPARALRHRAAPRLRRAV
jgi:peptidoglycan/LPS O-acetylase OafA/YrhL